MDYRAKINEKMIAIKDITTGKIRLKYMTTVPISFNPVGLLVLNLCNEGKTVNETVDVILDRCDMPESERARVTNDVFGLLNTLWKSGIITWDNGIFPGMEAYSETFDGYTLKECTIENAEELVTLIDTFGFDSFVRYNDNYLEKIEAAMLVMNVRFYEYKSESTRIIAQISYDSKINQVNLQGISFAGSEPDKQAFDRLVDWEIRRNIKSNMYVKNHFASMPVYMNVGNAELATLVEKLGFEKAGTLKQEVNMQDVDFYVKKVPLK